MDAVVFVNIFACLVAYFVRKEFGASPSVTVLVLVLVSFFGLFFVY